MQQYLKFSLLLFVAFLAFYACEKVKDDKIPPTLILKGSNPLVMFPGCSFVEPGFLLKDDLTPVEAIELVIDLSNVNTDSLGVYHVDYSATDADGNTAFARRKVDVRQLTLDYYKGKFLAKDTLKPLNQIVPPYHITCELFSSTFRWIKIYNFNNFGDNFNLIMIPDEVGNLELTYSLSDTLISGAGSTFCDMSGFRLEYQVETPDDGISVHHVTYKFD